MYCCHVSASSRAFSPFFLLGFGLGAVFFDGRPASSSSDTVVCPGFLRLRFVTPSFGGGMALLEGEGSAVDVPVEADGGPECGGGGGSCFVLGVAGTESNGDAVGRAGVAEGSRGASRCASWDSGAPRYETVPLIVKRFDAGVPMMLLVSAESLLSEVLRTSSAARLSVSAKGQHGMDCQADDLPRGFDFSAKLRSMSVRKESIVVASCGDQHVPTEDAPRTYFEEPQNLLRNAIRTQRRRQIRHLDISPSDHTLEPCDLLHALLAAGRRSHARGLVRLPGHIFFRQLVKHLEPLHLEHALGEIGRHDGA